MFARLPARRAIAAGAVILFHLLLIFALIRITGIPIGLPVIHENPLEIFFPSLKQKQKTETPPPPVVNPIYIPLRAPPPPTPVLPPSTPQTNYNGLRALGRYLYNCSGAYYEELSEREWAHCLGNLWDVPAEAKEQAPVMPPAKPSPFSIVVREPKKSAAPVERQCKLGEMNSNLGLPCYDFSGQ